MPMNMFHTHYLQKEGLMTKRYAIIAACVAGLVASPLYANGTQDSPKADSSHQHMWVKLGLNQSQQDQMKQLRKDAGEKMKASFEASKALRQKMKDELLKPNPDPAALDGLADQLAQLHKQMIKDRIANLVKTKQILTQDQFKKFLDMQEKMMKRFRHGGNHGNWTPNDKE
jgi:Spy/CpxP family protein refolding chaperone